MVKKLIVPSKPYPPNQSNDFWALCEKTNNILEVLFNP